MTFTVPLDNPRNVLHLVAVVEAFKELSDEIGNGFDVSGAGMHIATLFSKDASYPHDEDNYPKTASSPLFRLIGDRRTNSKRLKEAKLNNFKRAMTQLLPALYFLASTNENSRALRYRMPRISTSYLTDRFHDQGGNAHHSAINYHHGAFEFRIFDTCYDSPKMILDDVVVVSKCLHYLSERYISPQVDKIAKQITFGCDNSNKLERFYNTKLHLDTLNAGLAKLKPDYYTITELKKQRKFIRTTASIEGLRKEQEDLAHVEYQEYEERFKWRLKYDRQSWLGGYMQEIINSMNTDELRRASEAVILEQAEERVRERIARTEREKRTLDYFLQARLQNYDSNANGNYTLNFN
jgi:hypothetical protein